MSTISFIFAFRAAYSFRLANAKVPVICANFSSYHVQKLEQYVDRETSLVQWEHHTQFAEDLRE
jgi:hypothetical protein